MLLWKLFVFLFIVWTSFRLPRSVEARLVEEEVVVLKAMASTMGSKYWNFNPDNCAVELAGMDSTMPIAANTSVVCQCFIGTGCHVVRIILKAISLPGTLPPEIAKLPYLTYIDFALNYLHGSIPPEWFSMKLTWISVMVNRLSGNIPKGIGNMSMLTYLNLEANNFSGVIPPELGKLANLNSLIMSSNFLTGELPTSLAMLNNLTDFRINDNNLSGPIPNYIQNWKNLGRLELHASGLRGPIPSNISVLSNMTQLRISDIEGTNQIFPDLNSMKNLIFLILRSCNLVGGIPSALWNIDSLELLDLSFNKLDGKIPPVITGKHLSFIFLTGNMLTGDIPDSILLPGANVDLSYNNFTLQDPASRVCKAKEQNSNINLYRGASFLNSDRRAINPCWKAETCPRRFSCLHVHSGGTGVNVNNTVYIGDGEVEGSTAKLYLDDKGVWGFSSTGDFMDDVNKDNIRNAIQSDQPSLIRLYSSARITPITLTYFHRCLDNGKYTVILHFSELQFTNDATYKSLGRRVFDIYVQDRLVQKDFNIVDQVHGAQTPFQLPIRDVNVTNNFLEVRLYFAGKGTTRIPKRGVYGPIISALSFVSDTSGCPSSRGKKAATYIVAGIVGSISLLLILLGAFLWGHNHIKRRKRTELVASDDIPTGNFSLYQIKTATNDFGPDNKIGEGGFGPVYKGVLSDGSVVAVKQLSSKSRQGNREFLNEIGMISCLRHPNLVKLHGFCVEGDQLLLVYEYMENNNLARALFGHQGQRLQLDWVTRQNICLGIARGLAFLHEESRLKIVHRDIKATNVLLDKNLTPKISDFGLARLDEEENTHISTRIAGTIGYMAPEYALWGYLTHKVDVYSFGVVALEVVSGKNINEGVPSSNCFCLLDWACFLNQNGDIMDFVDMTLRGNLNEEEEVKKVLKVALLCTNASPALRPSMSEVVAMLEGRSVIPEEVSEASVHSEDVRFTAMRGLEQMKRDKGNVSIATDLSSPSNSTFSYGMEHGLLKNHGQITEGEKFSNIPDKPR